MGESKMSFNNIKSFCKENWAVFVTLVLGFGQLYLFIYLMQQAALWVEHSTPNANIDSLQLLCGIWLLTLALSIAFPAIIISCQAHKIKKLLAEESHLAKRR